MTKGSCDPTPATVNHLQFDVADGQVAIDVTWAWDGISIWPDCDGPVQSIQVKNLGTTPYTLQIPNGRKAKTVTLTPGFNQTYTSAGQFKQFGVETYRDLLDVDLIPG